MTQNPALRATAQALQLADFALAKVGADSGLGCISAILATGERALHDVQDLQSYVFDKA